MSVALGNRSAIGIEITKQIYFPFSTIQFYPTLWGNDLPILAQVFGWFVSISGFFTSRCLNILQKYHEITISVFWSRKFQESFIHCNGVNFQIKDTSSAPWSGVHQLITELKQLLFPRGKERFYNNQTGKKQVHGDQ